MKQIITSSVYADFKTLSVYKQREYALGYRPVEQFIEISNLEGAGWYYRDVVVVPKITETGAFYFKKVVRNSCTYKNGRFYGGSAHLLLRYVMCIDSFWWLNSVVSAGAILPSVTMIPKYAVGMILDKKITNPEQLWKTIAKRSHHETHWKIVRFCREHKISMVQLKLACRDWLAIRDVEELPSAFFELLERAIIAGEQISCKWSANRMVEETKRISNKIDELLLEGIPDAHSWSEHGFAYEDFELIDSEKLATRTSNYFQNCVHTNYWKLIQTHQYICFASKDVCIGYQVLPDGDIMFDQCRGKYNVSVVNQTEIDAMIRPIAQQIVEQYKLEQIHI